MSIQEITDADSVMLSFIRHSRRVALPQKRADLRRHLWNAFLDGVEYLSACTDEAQGAIRPVGEPLGVDWDILDRRIMNRDEKVAVVWSSGRVTVGPSDAIVGHEVCGDIVVRTILRPAK